MAKHSSDWKTGTGMRLPTWPAYSSPYEALVGWPPPFTMSWGPSRRPTPQAAARTGATRSSARLVASSGQRRRASTMATGTAKSRPPKDDSPPCQMAKMLSA